MLGKIEGRRKRGWQRMRWLDGITNSTDMTLSKLREIVKGREGSLACCSMGLQSRTWLSDWMTTDSEDVFPIFAVCVCVFSFLFIAYYVIVKRHKKVKIPYSLLFQNFLWKYKILSEFYCILLYLDIFKWYLNQNTFLVINYSLKIFSV